MTNFYNMDKLFNNQKCNLFLDTLGKSTLISNINSYYKNNNIEYSINKLLIPNTNYSNNYNEIYDINTINGFLYYLYEFNKNTLLKENEYIIGIYGDINLTKQYIPYITYTKRAWCCDNCNLYLISNKFNIYKCNNELKISKNNIFNDKYKLYVIEENNYDLNNNEIELIYTLFNKFKLIYHDKNIINRSSKFDNNIYTIYNIKNQILVFSKNNLINKVSEFNKKLKYEINKYQTIKNNDTNNNLKNIVLSLIKNNQHEIKETYTIKTENKNLNNKINNLITELDNNNRDVETFLKNEKMNEEFYKLYTIKEEDESGPLDYDNIEPLNIITFNSSDEFQEDTSDTLKEVQYEEIHYQGEDTCEDSHESSHQDKDENVYDDLNETTKISVNRTNGLFYRLLGY